MPASRSPLADRFWSKVAKAGADECWTWIGRINKEVGYGYFDVGARPNMVSTPAHRIAYELAHGHPGGLFVLHRCDNRKCVNPAHLFLGTNADNMRDKIEKGRQLVGTKVKGSKLTPGAVVQIIQVTAGPGGWTNEATAKKYGVSVWAVRDIRWRRRWQHLWESGPYRPAPEGFAALVEFGHTPRGDSPYHGNGKPFWWAWWSPDKPESSPSPGSLPLTWWKAIPLVTMDYPNQESAMLAAALAWCDLTAEQRDDIRASRPRGSKYGLDVAAG